MIALTQRVDTIEGRDERRDALDQRWIILLLQAGLLPVLVSNSPAWVKSWLTHQSFHGVLLTGGNSLVSCGGNAPERDSTEKLLLDHALANGLPVLGVCRGMQVLLDRYGTPLCPVNNHIAARQEIEIKGKRVEVNSYHGWGTYKVPDEFLIWAKADDGVIKAVQHRQKHLWGIMWHPERFTPFRSEDISLLRKVFHQQEDET